MLIKEANVDDIDRRLSFNAKQSFEKFSIEIKEMRIKAQAMNALGGKAEIVQAVEIGNKIFIAFSSQAIDYVKTLSGDENFDPSEAIPVVKTHLQNFRTKIIEKHKNSYLKDSAFSSSKNEFAIEKIAELEDSLLEHRKYCEREVELTGLTAEEISKRALEEPEVVRQECEKLRVKKGNTENQIQEKVFCPVCKTSECKIERITSGDFSEFECIRCGSFSLTRTAIATIENANYDEKQCAVLSYYLKNNTDSKEVNPLTYKEIEKIVSTQTLPTRKKQLENFICYLGRNSTYFGKYIRTESAEVTLQGIVGTENKDNLHAIIKNAARIDLLIESKGWHEQKLTSKGWDFFEEIEGANLSKAVEVVEVTKNTLDIQNSTTLPPPYKASWTIHRVVDKACRIEIVEKGTNSSRILPTIDVFNRIKNMHNSQDNSTKCIDKIEDRIVHWYTAEGQEREMSLKNLGKYLSKNLRKYYRSHLKNSH